MPAPHGMRHQRVSHSVLHLVRLSGLVALRPIPAALFRVWHDSLPLLVNSSSARVARERGSAACSRMGKEKVVFAPYSRDQIIDIARDRLSGVPGTVFEDRAIQLVARKIASVSGDVRRALAVLRHAAELWEAIPEAGRPAAVNASLVSQAQKAMFSAVHMRVRPPASVHTSPCRCRLSCDRERSPGCGPLGLCGALAGRLRLGALAPRRQPRRERSVCAVTVMNVAKGSSAWECVRRHVSAGMDGCKMRLR